MLTHSLKTYLVHEVNLEMLLDQFIYTKFGMIRNSASLECFI